jgi:CheY-like chemotaxis protein
MPIATLALVDDDAEHRDLVARWLRRHGYTVHCFGSGDDLLNWAESAEEGVDAFFLDVDMPGRDGFESCRDLRALERHAATPAVFVTSNTSEAAEQKVRAAGGDYLVRKDASMLGELRAILTTLSGVRTATP